LFICVPLFAMGADTYSVSATDGFTESSFNV
jgi:hypothetical protein